jgi:Na+-transporting NADH:ubiquinone oxidoreductase subunit F
MILTTAIAVVVVSSIAAALAALLVLSEYFIANYGECDITVNQERNLTVQGGGSLLSALINEKIFIPSACGGRGTCGLCKLKVTQGAGALLPTEEPFLTEQEVQSDVRVSCQIKVRNDLEIEIPAELFAIREYTCRCTEIIDLTYDIKQFRFELIEPDTIDYIPGQYVQLLAPVYEKSSEEVYRAYSMSGDPADKAAIETIIRLVPGGICTTYCFEHLKVGDTVNVNGPYGDFRLSDTDAPIVFVAGGSGMAPIKCMLHEMLSTRNARKATYYFGANTVKDMFLAEQMRAFESQLAGFRFVPAVAAPQSDEHWEGQVGLVTDVVRRDLKNAARAEAYLCGSPGMIDAATKVLLDLGMKEDKIFYDKFE